MAKWKKPRRPMRGCGHEDPAYSGEYGAPPKLPKRKGKKKR